MCAKAGLWGRRDAMCQQSGGVKEHGDQWQDKGRGDTGAGGHTGQAHRRGQGRAGRHGTVATKAAATGRDRNEYG